MNMGSPTPRVCDPVTRRNEADLLNSFPSLFEPYVNNGGSCGFRVHVAITARRYDHDCSQTPDYTQLDRAFSCQPGSLVVLMRSLKVAKGQQGGILLNRLRPSAS